MNIGEMRDRLAGAWEIVRFGRDQYEIGGPALDAEGKPMRRCTRCGIPRGTLRHGLLCGRGDCDDPDANRKNPE